MSHLRANTSRIAFVLFSIALWFLPSPAQAQLERVTLGYPATAMSHFPAFVGREFGQFREEGLDVQLVRVSGNVVVAALLAGELGYTTSADATVRSPVLGMPIKMLAAIGVKPSLSLIVRPEIKTVADLKGKRSQSRRPEQRPILPPEKSSNITASIPIAISPRSVWAISPSAWPRCKAEPLPAQL